MKLTILLAFALSADAQPRLIATAPARALPGQQVSVTLNLVGTVGSGLVALQWDVPAGATLATQPNIPNKSVICSSATCMLIGITPQPIGPTLPPNVAFNATLLPDTPVQNLLLTIPANAVMGSTITVSASALAGVSATGTAVAVGASAASILILNPLDLNQDGAVTAADAQIAFTAWLASRSTADLVTLVKIVGLL